MLGGKNPEEILRAVHLFFYLFFLKGRANKLMQLLQIVRWLMQDMHDFDLARRRAEIFHFFLPPDVKVGS